MAIATKCKERIGRITSLSLLTRKRTVTLDLSPSRQQTAESLSPTRVGQPEKESQEKMRISGNIVDMKKVS